MKWIRIAGFPLLMFVILLRPQAASAQSPYQPFLNVSAAGVSVTIQWTPIAGAQGYNIQVGTAPGASDIGSINLPSLITRIVVAAPTGTYYLRVRAFAGSLLGPFSNEASITVGTSCVPPPAPSATASVTGANVTINWNAVTNVLGYRVEFGQTPGSTALVQNVLPTTTSFTQSSPIAGTFFARVVAGNSCGTSTSNEVSFTIGGGGSGPRTPDPPPGQRLPMPGYGPAVAQAVANAYRGDLNRSCVEAGGNNIWLFRLVQALRQHDSRWGLNWKRQIFGDMSQDIVTYNHSAGADEDTRNVYGIDVIVGHCGPSPNWNWHDVTDPNGAGARWTLLPYLAAGFPP